MKNIVYRKDIQEFPITKIEGAPLNGDLAARKMVLGSNGLLIEFDIKKGTSSPPHTHKHESLLYIVKGRVKVMVGNESGIVETGDAILHPAGVEHSCLALEDSFWVEVKVPPEETW